jgi:Recombination endonuclease VII
MASSLDKFFADIYEKYGITPIEYRAIYRAQGGRCFICRRATGASKRLGVDHNHLTGDVRVLLCTGSLNANTCNRLIALYNRASLLRAVEVLSENPPAQRVLRAMRVEEPKDVLIPSLVGNPDFYLHEITR